MSRITDIEMGLYASSEASRSPSGYEPASDTVQQWTWMMDYCKRQGIPPAQKWAWDRAEREFNSFKGVIEMSEISEIRRKVVGLGEIKTETIRKEKKTRNTVTQTIIRKTVKAIVLDCGHKIEVTRFNKVPTSNTRCYECEQERDN